MLFFKKLLDYLTLGSNRPIRRLIAYYAILGGVIFVLTHFFPVMDRLFSGERLDQLAKTPQLLQDGLTGAGNAATLDAPARLDLALTTALVFLGAVVLMLPVSWVYMSAKKEKAHDQSIVQALIVLPIVVAGVVLIVRNSLALAFSLAGIVAAVRFRTNLGDARDVVFIFLGIAVGFAAGVQMLSVAILLSMVYNFVVLFIWRYDFGRNVLEPNQATQWVAPLNAMAKSGAAAPVADRDLVLALTPKKVQMLSERFNRVKAILGSNGKKPRYNAVLAVRTTSVSDAQKHVESVLESDTKRWRLDEIVTNEGKPSEIYYLVRTRREMASDDLVTRIRNGAAGLIESIDVEIGTALHTEHVEERAERKEAMRG
ncbi:MAG TPA: DUF4956 domain-containing protein [Gemmatimonadaceae bacterium]|nr:DUF4956 domain-containing protein [Gemmatimonadaceae bacterium]